MSDLHAQPVDQGESNSLQILADSLSANAAAFRRRGQDCCAQQSENILARLREAIDRAAVTA